MKFGVRFRVTAKSRTESGNLLEYALYAAPYRLSSLDTNPSARCFRVFFAC
jgi:hypothetical protein